MGESKKAGSRALCLSDMLSQIALKMIWLRSLHANEPWLLTVIWSEISKYLPQSSTVSHSCVLAPPSQESVTNYIKLKAIPWTHHLSNGGNVILRALYHRLMSQPPTESYYQDGGSWLQSTDDANGMSLVALRDKSKDWWAEMEFNRMLSNSNPPGNSPTECESLQIAWLTQ